MLKDILFYQGVKVSINTDVSKCTYLLEHHLQCNDICFAISKIAYIFLVLKWMKVVSLRNSQNGNISTFYLDIYLVSSTTSYEIRNRKWNSQIDDLYYRIKNVNDDMYCALRIRENMYVGDSSKRIMVDDLDCQIITIKVLSFLVFSLNWGNNYVKKEVTWSCLPFLN